MIKTISRTQDTILVVDDATVKTARADHPKWDDIQHIFDQISYENNCFIGPTDELLALMDMRTVVESYTVGLLSVNSLGVTYAGRPLHTIDAERVMAFMRDKLSYKPIANYIIRKMKNPSARAIAEMYNFLEHRGMPLTLRGTFIAYKGVTTDFWSINGNKETVVLHGEVDAQGRILNKVGATIEVERSSVDDNFREGCSFGLHAGSITYAKGWGERVMLVEIDPADVVSVPEDCSCQKLRCCKYTVVGEYTGPMPDTLTTEFDANEPDVCHTCGASDGDCDCEDQQTHEDADCEYVECKKERLAAEADQSNVTVAVPPPNVAVPPPDVQPETPDESWILTREPVHDLLGLNSDTMRLVCDIISEQFGVSIEGIKPGTRMDSDWLALDSLDGVELAMALEEEFEIEIPDEDAEKGISATVADICKYIDARLEGERARTATPLAHADPNYVFGRKEGSADRVRMMGSPKWLSGDEAGADSQPHLQYILGYVAGYSGK